MSNPAFVSGSRAYGIPTVRSDVDLVVMTTKETALWLQAEFARGTEDLYPPSSTVLEGSVSVVVDKLNLILCWDEKVYNIWLEGTRTLCDRAPVTRIAAKALFAKLRLDRL